MFTLLSYFKKMEAEPDFELKFDARCFVSIGANNTEQVEGMFDEDKNKHFPV